MRLKPSPRTVAGLALPLLASACTTVLSPAYGVRQGHLAGCPAERACVSSQAENPARRISPFHYRASQAVARGNLLAALRHFADVRILSSHRNYLLVSMPSEGLGADLTSYPPAQRNVADLEFYFLPGERLIEVRSVSRSRAVETGENRARVEAIRKFFEARETHRVPK